jgi:hypothetical protein
VSPLLPTSIHLQPWEKVFWSPVFSPSQQHSLPASLWPSSRGLHIDGKARTYCLGERVSFEVWHQRSSSRTTSTQHTCARGHTHVHPLFPHPDHSSLCGQGPPPAQRETRHLAPQRQFIPVEHHPLPHMSPAHPGAPFPLPSRKVTCGTGTIAAPPAAPSLDQKQRARGLLQGRISLLVARLPTHLLAQWHM